MPTLQEIEDEIERRELIASIQSAPTATEQQPAGPVPTPQQGLAGLRDAMQAGAVRDREEEELGLTNAAAQFTRGLVPGANFLGASVAAIPAKYLHGDERALSDIRDEMLELEDVKEEKLDEIDPGLKTAGTVAGVGSLAAAPARALGGALARKGSAALAGTKSGARAARGAVSKPRVRVPAGGALPQATKKTSRLKGAVEGAKVGAGLDVTDAAITGDLTPDMMLGGAAVGMGALGPALKAIKNSKAVKNVGSALVDSPGGRKILSYFVGKTVGPKTANAAWHGLNPANQAKLKRIWKEL